MASWAWQGQDTAASDVEITATDELALYDTTFHSAIPVGEYQDSSHVETSGLTDKCATNHIHNTKYVSSTQVDIDGGGTESLSGTAPTEAECPLRIEFSHTVAVETSDAEFWAYDGTTETNGPTDVTFQAGEQGDTTWTNAEGSGSAVSVDDHTSAATDHDFYLFVSVSPDTAGYKDAFTYKMTLTYA
jgi:hypothetical protein